MHVQLRCKGEREFADRSGLAGQAGAPAGYQLTAIVIPYVRRDAVRQRQKADIMLGGPLALDGAQGLADERKPRRVSPGEQGRQAVEQPVGRGRRARGRWRGECRSRHLRDAGAWIGETAGKARGEQRLQVCRPAEASIHTGQALGRPQQLERGSAVPVRGERGLSPDELRPGSLRFGEMPGLGHGQQVKRWARRAGHYLGLGGGHRSPGQPGLVAGQLCGPLKERGRHRQFPARARAGGRALELAGDVLVGTGGTLAQVPGAPGRVEKRIGGLG